MRADAPRNGAGESVSLTFAPDTRGEFRVRCKRCTAEPGGRLAFWEVRGSRSHQAAEPVHKQIPQGGRREQKVKMPVHKGETDLEEEAETESSRGV